MTYEEAIDYLKLDIKMAMFDPMTGEYQHPNWEALQVIKAQEKAIEALEKQIPKKVEWTEDYTWGKKTDQPVCPVCDYYLTMHHFIECSKKISYCDKCGQAIDWSE